MKYKGYEIIPVYLTGTNFRILKDGSIRDRKPRKDEVEYFEIYGDKDSFREGVEMSIEECKHTIDYWIKLEESC